MDLWTPTCVPSHRSQAHRVTRKRKVSLLHHNLHRIVLVYGFITSTTTSDCYAAVEQRLRLSQKLYGTHGFDGNGEPMVDEASLGA